MTDLTREQIEALLKGTTPGDWSVATDPCHYDTASDVVCGKNLHASVGGKAGWREQEANTRIMAAAPDLARQLLATMIALAEAQAAQAGVAQCCICGKKGLSTAEDGGPECELHDGRWVCSRKCWEVASDLAEAQKREAGLRGR